MNAITLIPAHEMPAEELALAARDYQLAKLPTAVRVAVQIGEAEIIKRGDALLTEASKITEVADKAGRTQAHTAGQALIKLRTEIERKAKAMRDDSNAYSKECIAAEKRLVARTKPAEDAVLLLRDQFDAAEKTRKAAHEAALQAIRARAILPSSMPASELQAAIGAVQFEFGTREWEEYHKQAKATADEVCLCLETTISAAKAREAAEAKAREEAARLEAERLAREAEEQAEREAAEREAARQAKHAKALIDLELGIARKIRDARTIAEAQALVNSMTERWCCFADCESEAWEEFSGEAGACIKDGYSDATAHLERLKWAEAQAQQARISELRMKLFELSGKYTMAAKGQSARTIEMHRDAAIDYASEIEGDPTGGEWGEFAQQAALAIKNQIPDLDAMLAAARKVEAEAQAEREAEAQAAREAEEKAQAEARATVESVATQQPAPEASAPVQAEPEAPAPTGIRWGELCAVLGHEIPPWVLAAMGCESESGVYSSESLTRLHFELQSMADRAAVFLDK